MLEKFYIFLTRWFTLIVATLAFAMIVFGSLYAVKLYYDSQDTSVNEEPYRQKKPDIRFDEIKKMQDEKLKEVARIRDYVVKVIREGSSGHGYPIQQMPKGLIKDHNETVALGLFIARGLKGEKPKAFSMCIACHGQDGRGNKGAAPDLTRLPIYHGLRQRVSAAKKPKIQRAPTRSLRRQSPTPKVKSPVEILIDRIGSNINRYAMFVDQPGISKGDLQSLLMALTDGLSEEEIKLYLRQLATASDSLLEYGKAYRASVPDIPALDWREFLYDFSREFKAFIKQERQKARQREMLIQREKMAKEMRAEQASNRLYRLGMAMGIALLVFLVLTMVLVLLKIERNTRSPEEEKEKNAHPEIPQKNPMQEHEQ